MLIYDNVIDAATLTPYLPFGGAARVLVTRTPMHGGVAAPVEIHLWPQQIGADYLIARTGRTGERDAAQALSEVLGGLPLAYEQAAAYCEDLGIGLAEYRHRFEATTIKFLDDKDYAPAEYHDRRTVAGTFMLGIDEAAKCHPAAELLIVHAALLAPEPIPLFLFAEARDKFEEPLASTARRRRPRQAPWRRYALSDLSTASKSWVSATPQSRPTPYASIGWCGRLRWRGGRVKCGPNCGARSPQRWRRSIRTMASEIRHHGRAARC